MLNAVMGLGSGWLSRTDIVAGITGALMKSLDSGLDLESAIKHFLSFTLASAGGRVISGSMGIGEPLLTEAVITMGLGTVIDTVRGKELSLQRGAVYAAADLLANFIRVLWGGAPGSASLY